MPTILVRRAETVDAAEIEECREFRGVALPCCSGLVSRLHLQRAPPRHLCTFLRLVYSLLELEPSRPPRCPPSSRHRALVDLQPSGSYEAYNIGGYPRHGFSSKPPPPNLTLAVPLSLSFSQHRPGLSLCLFRSLSLSLSFSLCHLRSISLSLSLCFFRSLSVSFVLSLSLSPSLPVSFVLSLSLPLSLSPSSYLSLCLSLSLSFSLSLSLSLILSLSVVLSLSGCTAIKPCRD